MLSSDGGVNVAIGGREYRVAGDNGSLLLRNKRQADAVEFLLRFMALDEAGEQFLTNFTTATTLFSENPSSLLSYYNYLIAQQDAWYALAGAAQALEVPPGFQDVVDRFSFAQDNRGDAAGHVASFLNDGDLEEQRKATQDFEEAGAGMIAAGASLFLALEDVGLRSDTALEMLTCEAEPPPSCFLTVPADPSTIFRE
jgi:hypothetical protein